MPFRGWQAYAPGAINCVTQPHVPMPTSPGYKKRLEDWLGWLNDRAVQAVAGPDGGVCLMIHMAPSDQRVAGFYMVPLMLEPDEADALARQLLNAAFIARAKT